MNSLHPSASTLYLPLSLEPTEGFSAACYTFRAKMRVFAQGGLTPERFLFCWLFFWVLAIGRRVWMTCGRPPQDVGGRWPKFCGGRAECLSTVGLQAYSCCMSRLCDSSHGGGVLLSIVPQSVESGDRVAFGGSFFACSFSVHHQLSPILFTSTSGMSA